MFPQSVPVYPLPDTAFVFKYFQAAERLTWIAHDASDALSSATGQETVPALGRAPEISSVDPALLQDIRTAPASSVRECNPTAPVLNSEVFQEEVSDIAQVHCENELFEFELTDHPPLVNVEGNLRRKIEFWKRIETSEFILNVIEKGYMLPFFSLPEPADLETTDHPLPMLNLSRMLYVNWLSRVVLLKLTYLRWWSTPCQFPFKPLAKRDSFLI